MFEQRDGKILITFEDKIVEKNLKEVYESLKEFKIKNREFSEVVIDLKKVKEIDFFGFQILFLFYKSILGETRNDSGKISIKKSEVFLNFEEKMGLKI
ncbi:MAG TPA: hypothetical protein PLO89_07215 [Spirochaetota bacterium]|nr:hypothetical protein [Spirochaetota bacterium]